LLTTTAYFSAKRGVGDSVHAQLGFVDQILVAQEEIIEKLVRRYPPSVFILVD
jgi:hypothetical protein